MPDTFVVLGQRGGTPSPLHSRRLAQRIHKVRQVLVCVLVAFDQELRLLSEDLQAPSYLRVTGLRRVKNLNLLLSRLTLFEGAPVTVFDGRREE